MDGNGVSSLRLDGK